MKTKEGATYKQLLEARKRWEMDFLPSLQNEGSLADLFQPSDFRLQDTTLFLTNRKLTCNSDLRRKMRRL